MSENQPLDIMTYEEAFNALEEVVEIIEQEQLPLAQVLDLYGRGLALAKRCTELLEQAELCVRQVSGEELLPFQGNG